MEELNLDGVTVQRGVCGGHLIESCRGFFDENLEKYLALPGPMSAANEMRHFVQFSTSRELSPKQHFSHRSQFVLPIAGTCEAVLKTVLSGTCGTILSNILGDDAELCGLLSITSRPGCPAQSMHSDGMWSESSPRLITMFLAVHNILDEAQGPTLFITQTHRPDCFAGERWLPPTDELVSQRDPIWFKLKAGDIVLMDQTTWHCGGANTSDQMRTLLSFSFVARSGPMSNDKLRLGDFRNG